MSRPANLESQWALGSRGSSGPRADHSLETRSLELAWFDPLPVTRVFDAGGRSIGIFVGHPVDYRAGEVVRSECHLAEVLLDNGDIVGFIERNIYKHSGSWLFVLDCEAGRRLYLDADGTLSAVWDPATGVAAATAAMLLDDKAYVDRFERSLYRHLDVVHDGWFPAGLTAHRGIERLLVNHYLDLDTATAHRHWPVQDIVTTDNPSEACLSIADVARKTIGALRKKGDIAVTLTSGNETRLLLACCRDIAQELEFVTVSGPETRLDCFTAGKLAESEGLRHRLLPVLYADAAGQELWHARTGHCMGGSNMLTHPSIGPMADLEYFVVGLGGEIGRGFLWRAKDTARTKLDAETIERRLGMRPHTRVREAIGEWLVGVQGFESFFTQIDLAYLELRMGCWGYALSYVFPEVVHISPLISRESYSLMLSLPPQWRRSNMLIVHTIDRLWPELLGHPINRYGDFRDYARKIRRVIMEPKLVTKKLRKMMG